MSRQDLVDLCSVSGRNNRGVEITGFLLTTDDRFLQALEGPRDAIEDTFIRIIKDRRHHGVTVLSRRVITRRDFGDWEMACYEDPRQLEPMLERVAALTSAAPVHVQRAFAAVLRQDAAFPPPRGRRLSGGDVNPASSTG